MKETHYVLGVHVTDRLVHAAQVQQVLTEFGSSIKTRLGLHEVGPGTAGSPNGLLILEVVPGAAGESLVDSLATKLAAIQGIEVQRMVFKH